MPERDGGGRNPGWFHLGAVCPLAPHPSEPATLRTHGDGRDHGGGGVIAAACREIRHRQDLHRRQQVRSPAYQPARFCHQPYASSDRRSGTGKASIAVNTGPLLPSTLLPNPWTRCSIHWTHPPLFPPALPLSRLLQQVCLNERRCGRKLLSSGTPSPALPLVPLLRTSL